MNVSMYSTSITLNYYIGLLALPYQNNHERGRERPRWNDLLNEFLGNYEFMSFLFADHLFTNNLVRQF